MASGIILRNANGDIYFNTDTITWNFIGSYIASANATESVDFPTLALMSEVLIQRFFVDTAPGNQEAYIHSASRSGITVTSTGGNVRTLIVVLGH